MHTRLSCLIVIGAMAVVIAQEVPAKAKLYGTVKDQSGAVNPLAVVLVHRDPGQRKKPDFSKDIRLEVNERGQYSTSLEPGLYDVVVFASVFSPQCAKVLVTEEAGQRDFTLHFDPELTKSY